MTVLGSSHTKKRNFLINFMLDCYEREASRPPVKRNSRSSGRMLPDQNDVNHDHERTARTASGLEPYRGPWNSQTAGHLLRRAMFGASRSEVSAAANSSLASVVGALLAVPAEPAPPVDPTTGTTWIGAAFNSDSDSRCIGYVRAWWLGLMALQGVSIREKMVLFWHNHFATDATTVQDSRYLYRQNALLRQYALGNIRDFVKSISVDPAMLVYLNGYRSRGDGNYVPDENYARELQELFTIGKGPQRGPDDYTNYTEADVKAAARVLSGWRILGYRTTTSSDIGSYFDPTKHDTRDKQFSSAYQGTLIRGGPDGQRELNDLVDMIFRQEATSLYLCRKLYRWFVYYDIDTYTEQNVIVPLARIMRESDYEVAPVLSALFQSAHFFDANNIGCQIRNPLDFTLATIRLLNIAVPSPATQTATHYSLFASVRSTASVLQMSPLDPPAVAGWEPFYQIPEYYRLWLNTVTLPARWGYTDSLVNGLKFGTLRVAVDPLALVVQLPAPEDPYRLVEDLARQLFSIQISSAQRDNLVFNVLLPGLPDYEWPVEWSQYLANPTSSKARDPIIQKLNSLLKYMMRMSEFQLT
jgi:uncharacterized protein (DUF1800 family)